MKDLILIGDSAGLVQLPRLRAVENAVHTHSSSQQNRLENENRSENDSPWCARGRYIAFKVERSEDEPGQKRDKKHDPADDREIP